jgi:hypothetical protein
VNPDRRAEMDEESTSCHNPKCGDTREEGELFCPSCRLAIGIGMKYGATVMFVAVLVISAVVELLR